MTTNGNDRELMQLVLHFWNTYSEHETAAGRHREVLARCMADPGYPDHPGASDDARERAELIYRAHGLTEIADARNVVADRLKATIEALFLMPAHSQWAIGKKIEIARYIYTGSDGEPAPELEALLPDDDPAFLFDCILHDLALAPESAWPRFVALYAAEDGRLHLSRAFDAPPVPGTRDANPDEAETLTRLARFVIRSQRRELRPGIDTGPQPDVKAIYTTRRSRPLGWELPR